MFRENLNGGMSMSVFGIATSLSLEQSPLNTVKSDSVESFKSAVSLINH
jgi:hypothetical protein